MNIAITGHRPNKLWNDYELKSGRTQQLKEMIMDKVIEIKTGLEQAVNKLPGRLSPIPLHLITGMALGVDTLFAKIAVELKIPFIAAVPFPGQEKMWPLSSQQTYSKLLNEAEDIVYVCKEGYAAWKMQKRNEWMVDNCDILIAVWDGSNGGTANCVKYAESKNKTIIRIDPSKL